MTNVAVVGAGGFVGSAVSWAVQAQGWNVVPVRAPRIGADLLDVFELLRRYGDNGPSGVIDSAAARGWRLDVDWAGVDAVVNAAGLARPSAGRAQTPRLLGGNAVVPLMLRCVQQLAGVPRLLHISSAAVLGRATLSSTTALQPLTPYAQSKAVGEACLLSTAGEGAGALHIYRPTSVQAAGGGGSLKVLRWTPLVPVGRPAGPSTVISPEDVGVAVVDRLRAWPAELISVHPSNGDVASFLCGLNPKVRLVPYSRRAGERVFSGLCAAAGWSPPLLSVIRRIEVVVQGQDFTQEAKTVT